MEILLCRNCDHWLSDAGDMRVKDYGGDVRIIAYILNLLVTFVAHGTSNPRPNVSVTMSKLSVPTVV